MIKFPGIAEGIFININNLAKILIIPYYPELKKNAPKLFGTL